MGPVILYDQGFATLTDRLLSESRLEDLQKAIKSVSHRKVLYQEHGI